MIAKSSVQLVEKEQIKSLVFPKEDVLEQKEDKSIRATELRRAMSLGNLEKQKVKIFFADDSGLKKVETTIWGITDTSVILKKCTTIPLQRIISVA